MVALIAENAKTGSYTPEFDERYRTIAEEIKALKEAQKTARNEKQMSDSYEPVSYTHLDVYKRQGMTGADVRVGRRRYG